MSDILELNTENVKLFAKIAGCSMVGTALLYVGWKKLAKPARKKYNLGREAVGKCLIKLIRGRWRKIYPKDTVIHHQIGRAPNVPSMTPFAVKLETYLRMAKIPYLNVHDKKVSKKGKLTWIEYNGEEISDSEFCIEYLNQRLGINLNENFSARDLGAARAFQKMIEENTYWTVVMERWFYDTTGAALKILRIPYIIGIMLRKQLKQQTISQGIGRHSQEEVYHIMEKDVKALSDFIGERKFLLGDTPCQEDCAIFGMIVELCWQENGLRGEAILHKHRNLVDYCQRMKERFWPDWDDCTTHGGTQEATK